MKAKAASKQGSSKNQFKKSALLIEIYNFEHPYTPLLLLKEGEKEKKKFRIVKGKPGTNCWDFIGNRSISWKLFREFGHFKIPKILVCFWNFTKVRGFLEDERHHQQKKQQ